MPGLTCNCSRCGILLRLMHSAPPGAPILCVHCSSLAAVTSWKPAPEPVPPEQDVARAGPAPQSPGSDVTGPTEGGLVEDRAWERLQARQRKKALGMSLLAMGGVVVLLVVVLVIGSGGGGSKTKGRGQTPAGEREKQADEERPFLPRPPGGAAGPRREEEEDPDPGRPLRPIPVPDR
jgi:hypothetical protein